MKVKRARRQRSHTGRNIAIVGALVFAVIAAVVLSGALSPPASFTVLIHVYDSAYGTPQTITDQKAFIDGVNVTVSGPRSFSAIVNGVLPPEQIGNLPEGTYEIAASKTGYESADVTYSVGPNCLDRDFYGACHVWIAMRQTA